MLPPVAAVLPPEKLNETLVKSGLLPCCRLKKDELEAQGRRVLGSNHKDILRIPYSAVKNAALAMSGRGRCDARVLQVLQISQIVAPLLHPKSLIINVCSTVAGGGGYRILCIHLPFGARPEHGQYAKGQ